MYLNLGLLLGLMAVARAQQGCSVNPEVHPSLTWTKCVAGSGCNPVTGSVTLDANYRWTHTVSGYTNCYSGTWDPTLCPDGATCAANCCLDGADYAGTYGVTTPAADSLKLKFVTTSPTGGKNVGSRVYLMASDTAYQTFTLSGNEFTFDVDASALPCGVNGALYFVNMDADGGRSRFSSNSAGAKFGTGYCDAQCPHDIHFVDGKANLNGNVGTCCPEMDIWEANSISTAFTAHPCLLTNTQTSCTGASCSLCDKGGCDFNTYRQGNKTFYGPGSQFTIDSTKKITVVTQFPAVLGVVTEIRRLYVQDGKVVANAATKVPAVGGNSISTAYCPVQKLAFGDPDTFTTNGGMVTMSTALASPMVLVMSIWDDHASNMLWLDSNYPAGANPTNPGVARGSCATTSGVPSDVEASSPNSAVVFSNIKFGPIGYTYPSVAHYGQCGGAGYTGPTQCLPPYVCTYQTDYNSQCL